MKIGIQSVLMTALAAMSSCSAPPGPAPFAEIERPRDDFTRRAVPQNDAALPPPVEVAEVFPPDEEGGS